LGKRGGKKSSRIPKLLSVGNVKTRRSNVGTGRAGDTENTENRSRPRTKNWDRHGRLTIRGEKREENQRGKIREQRKGGAKEVTRFTEERVERYGGES